MNKKFLYYGGIFSILFYLINDVVGGIVTPGYNHIVNAVSELTQAGTQDTYLLGSVFLFIGAVMGIVFGIGIVVNHGSGHSRLIFFGGILICISAFFSSLTGTVFPMDPIGADTTFAGTMHLVLVGVNVVLTIPAIVMLAVGLYRERVWRSFRLYSIITLIVMVVFGILSPVVIISGIELMGLFERIVAYAYMLWVFVMAGLFLRE